MTYRLDQENKRMILCYKKEFNSQIDFIAKTGPTSLDYFSGGFHLTLKNKAILPNSEIAYVYKDSVISVFTLKDSSLILFKNKKFMLSELIYACIKTCKNYYLGGFNRIFLIGEFFETISTSGKVHLTEHFPIILYEKK